jgi:hypothetical protein
MQDADATEAARQAAEALRTLNHVTIRSDGYCWPSEVNAVVAELQLSATRIVQALEQGRRWLQHAQADGRVGHDQGSELTAVTADVSDRFIDAVRGAERLAEHLGELQNFTAHLTGIDPSMPDLQL